MAATRRMLLLVVLTAISTQLTSAQQSKEATITEPGSYELPTAPPFAQLSWFTPVHKLCGRLTTLTGKGTLVPVPNTRLSLYKAKWRSSCCKQLKLVAHRVTTKDGLFDFGDVKSGQYWVALDWLEKQNATTLDIDTRHDWEGTCQSQGMYIDKNRFSFAIWKEAEL